MTKLEQITFFHQKGLGLNNEKEMLCSNFKFSSSAGSVMAAVLVVYKLLFNKRRNIQAAMRRSFSYDQYFSHSKVLAIAVWCADKNVDDSVTTSSLRSSFACFNLFRKFWHGLIGNSEVLKKLGPFKQQISTSVFADKPLVPASAGLSAD